jgi:hypothetical protein
MIPENTDDIDAETLASLPPTLRKHVIEQARYLSPPLHSSSPYSL